MSKHLYTIGQKILVSVSTEVEILKIEEGFFKEPHYGIRTYVKRVSKPTETKTGWISCYTLDNLNGVVVK